MSFFIATPVGEVTVTSQTIQDDVGNTLTDSSTVDFTYDAGAHTITASVIQAALSLTASQISDFDSALDLSALAQDVKFSSDGAYKVGGTSANRPSSVNARDSLSVGGELLEVSYSLKLASGSGQFLSTDSNIDTCYQGSAPLAYDSSTPFSVSFWLKAFSNIGAYAHVFSTWDDDGVGLNIFLNSSGDGNPGTLVMSFREGGSDGGIVRTSVSVCDGSWHQITCTYDPVAGATNTQDGGKIYIDGVLDSSVAAGDAGDHNFASTVPPHIGPLGTNELPSENGPFAVHDLATWDIDLDLADVAEIVAASGDLSDHTQIAALNSWYRCRAPGDTTSLIQDQVGSNDLAPSTGTGALIQEIVFPGNVTIQGSLDATVPTPTVDHGALTGLSDDDHAQYFKVAGRSGEDLSMDGDILWQSDAGGDIGVYGGNRPGNVTAVTQILTGHSVIGTDGTFEAYLYSDNTGGYLGLNEGKTGGTYHTMWFQLPGGTSDVQVFQDPGHTFTFGEDGSFQFLGNADPGAQTNSVAIGAKDSSGAARTLSIATEEAPTAEVALVSTHKLKVWINGTEYYLALTAV